MLEAVQRLAGNGAAVALLQRGAVPRGVGRPRDVVARLARATGGGQRLDPRVQRRAEAVGGVALDDVRVHTGTEAAELSADLGAQAFTYGRDVFFGQGRYEPDTPTGARVIGHELGHVVGNARGSRPAVQKLGDGLAIGEEGSEDERHADRFAEAMSGAGHDAAVQRDSCGCGGSCGPCSGGEDKDKDKAEVEGQPAVQRLPLGAGAPVIQRLTDPFGTSSVVDWFPGGSVSLFDKNNQPTPGGGALNFGGSDAATVTLPDRTATAKVNMPVTAKWHGGGVVPPNPGPNPAPKKCDVCTALKDAGTAAVSDLLAEVINRHLSLPLIPDFIQREVLSLVLNAVQSAAGNVFNLVPASLLAQCATISIDDAIGRMNGLKTQVRKIIDKGDCSGAPDLAQLCKVLSSLQSTVDDMHNLTSIPVLKQAVIAVQGALQKQMRRIKREILHEVEDRIDDIVDALNKAREKCKGSKIDPAIVTAGSGTATTLLTGTVFIAADGTVQVQANANVLQSVGTGAKVVNPVVTSAQSTPNSGSPAQIPTLISEGGAESAVAARPFTVNVNYPAPPVPQDITCPIKEFDNFKIDSDKFANENQRTIDIKDWYFGLDPEVRDEVEAGAASIKITGRASNTGSVTHNQKLAVKRAKKVESILANFAGSDSSPRTFALGLLGAKEAGEAGHERRADVQIDGQIPADRVAFLEGSMCEGHNGEPSRRGATQPTDQSDESKGTNPNEFLGDEDAKKELEAQQVFDADAPQDDFAFAFA